ncbi:hypothetical protein B9Z19DRAFT_766092 [Tuber borchii]|uniref:Uncharacterized protein n=1 Tax=Tuber borchii TaxID=42251 RepID=A0A2T6ZX68_TUBBO|nr:hypothetical protein B9Z19DRAFT_766092 [Tuber borchii]
MLQVAGACIVSEWMDGALGIGLTFRLWGFNLFFNSTQALLSIWHRGVQQTSEQIAIMVYNVPRCISERGSVIVRVQVGALVPKHIIVYLPTYPSEAYPENNRHRRLNHISHEHWTRCLFRERLELNPVVSTLSVPPPLFLSVDDSGSRVAARGVMFGMGLRRKIPW